MNEWGRQIWLPDVRRTDARFDGLRKIAKSECPPWLGSELLVRFLWTGVGCCVTGEENTAFIDQLLLLCFARPMRFFVIVIVIITVISSITPHHHHLLLLLPLLLLCVVMRLSFRPSLQYSFTLSRQPVGQVARDRHVVFYSPSTEGLSQVGSNLLCSEFKDSNIRSDTC